QALKSAPRGYPGDHPRIDLLRWKGLICWRDWPVAPWLHTAKARDRVTGFLRTAAPLQRWLDRTVGAGPAGRPGPRPSRRHDACRAWAGAEGLARPPRYIA